jgi:hypothetical protein
MNIQIVPKKYFILVLSAILFVGLVYISLNAKGNKVNKSQPTYNQEIKIIETQSSSDETDTIEKDLMETDLENIDQELDDIEKELNQIAY